MGSPQITWDQPQQQAPQIQWDQSATQPQAELRGPETGVRPWLRSLESDLRYGGQSTLPGRLLHKIGYQAPEPLGGEGGTAGSMMVSPLTGPTFAAHGVAEVAAGHPLRGTGEILSGIGEAAQIPMAFVAPETAEAATTSRTAQAIGAGARAIVPSAIRRIPYVGNVAGDVYDAGRNAFRAAGPARNRTIDSGEMADYMGGATPRQAASPTPGERLAAQVALDRNYPPPDLAQGTTEMEALRPQTEMRLRDAIQSQSQTGNFRLEQTPRRLPGEIAPEAPRPRAFSAKAPARPIPPRQGLMLPGPEAPSNTPPVRDPAPIRPTSAAEVLGQHQGGYSIDLEGRPVAPNTQAGSQRLSDQIKSGSDVTPQLRKSGSPFDATDSKAWQRYPQAGSKQDLAETRSLQEQVRDYAGQEQRGRLARANEEGYARNTRPRTPKSQLSQQFRSGKSGARLADKVRQGQGSSSEEDLTDILKTSLNQARAKKLGGNNPPTGESQ